MQGGRVHGRALAAVARGVLSRRWRGVWPPPASAVTFNISSIDSDRYHHRRREASLRGATEALAAAQLPVNRLSIHVGEGCEFVDIVVAAVLSYPASRCVEDVRIAADDSARKARHNDYSSRSWLPDSQVGEFEFSFGSMASAALRLRVLHITNCSDLKPPPPATTFRCLEVLRLWKCSVDLQILQDMVIASPQLAVLQLEYVFLSAVVRSSPMTPDEWAETDWQGYYNYIDSYSEKHCNFGQSLCCPGITTLVLLNCCYDAGKYIEIELDVPRVEHFSYRGKINQFTLRSPLPDVRRVNLRILANDYLGGDHQYEMFWNFLKNFGNTKVMKLKLEWPIDYIRVMERKRFMELLDGTLFDIEHLEIDARQNTMSKNAAMAIGNFLECCPAILDLRLKLSTADQPWRRNSRNPFLKSKALLEFDKSVDHFRRRRDRPVIPLCKDDDKVQVTSDIPGFSERWFHFSCLQSHLRRLSLQFQMDKPDCVGAELAKFFIERGMAIEEMYIHDGNTKLWEHMNCKISGYSAKPQPISDYQVLARMSQELSMNQFSSSKISGCCHPYKLEVRRTNPWIPRRSFTILPLADA